MKENVELEDTKVESTMGNLLRVGVLISAVVILTGGVIYLIKYGSALPEYSAFKGEPEKLKNFTSIFREALLLHGRGMIQFGLLVLIATPIARVIFALIAFMVQKDKIYIVVSAIVLITLLLSFFNVI